MTTSTITTDNSTDQSDDLNWDTYYGFDDSTPDYDSEFDDGSTPSSDTVGSGFLAPISMQVSDTSGDSNQQDTFSPQSPEELRAYLNDLQTKVKANTDISSDLRDHLLDEILAETRQADFAVSEAGDAQQATLKDAFATAQDTLAAMEGVPDAEKIIKKIDDLTKQVQSTDFPDDLKDQKKKLLASLGTTKSTLELDPTPENQKAAEASMKDVKDGIKKAEAAAAKEKKAADDMMKSLKGMSSGDYDETFILNRLQDSYGDKYDLDGDGKVSKDDFTKAVEKGLFPPAPDKKFLTFIYKIDPNLQKSLTDLRDDPQNADTDSIVAEIADDLHPLYPDAGIGKGDPWSCDIYYKDSKINLFNPVIYDWRGKGDDFLLGYEPQQLLGWHAE